MSSDFYSIQKIKSARKEHTCKCCRTKILIGEPYEQQTGVYEGRFYSQKVCPACSKILDYLFYEKVVEELDISQCLAEYMDDEIYKLLKEIQHPSQYVEDLIFEYEQEKLCEVMEDEV